MKGFFVGFYCSVNKLLLKALSHGAIFLATCNAVLLLGDVKFANTSFHYSLPMYFNIPNIYHKFTSLKSRIALQVARKNCTV